MKPKLVPKPEVQRVDLEPDLDIDRDTTSKRVIREEDHGPN